VSSHALDRLRTNLGDLFVVADYPGGARAMHFDLLQAENRNDRMNERMSLAILVLEGKADALVEAHWREDREYGVLCDQCQDLAARFLRTARDAARRDYAHEHKQLSALLSVVRRGLRSRGMLIEREWYDPDALVKRLGDFFSIFDFTATTDDVGDVGGNPGG
jgi:hypothetical protein